MCYSLRLDKVAKYAKDNGFDAFTTSLLVSPYQKHDLIKELGEKFALKYNIKFYYQDFRPFFREGQAMAKEMGLYRQKYCGCIVSYNERLEHLNQKVAK
jgi:predicted adenine nucleotide alpha hydrolase (AANH) superfamily ATPase